MNSCLKSQKYVTRTIEVKLINKVSVTLEVILLFSSSFERMSLSNIPNEYLGIPGTVISC